jgi:hypothetical protein
MLAPDTFPIAATSLADPSKTASANVTAVPLDNQKAQVFPIILGASGINAKSQDGTGSALVIRHEKLGRTDAIERHAAGWRGALDQLTELLAQEEQNGR